MKDLLNNFQRFFSFVWLFEITAVIIEMDFRALQIVYKRISLLF